MSPTFLAVISLSSFIDAMSVSKISNFLLISVESSKGPPKILTVYFIFGVRRRAAGESSKRRKTYIKFPSEVTLSNWFCFCSSIVPFYDDDVTI